MAQKEPHTVKYKTVTVDSLNETIRELENLCSDATTKQKDSSAVHWRWIDRVERIKTLENNGWRGETKNGVNIHVPEANRVYMAELLKIAQNNVEALEEKKITLQQTVKLLSTRIEELKKVTKELSLHESMSKNLQTLTVPTGNHEQFVQGVIDLMENTRQMKYQAEALIEIKIDPELRGITNGK